MLMEHDLHNVGRITTWFSQFATSTANLVGSPWAFLFACITILAWITTGPVFHYSDGWQLIVNSWTNIVTFIVVFLIQNSQNRDSKAINLKLDELLVSVQNARPDLIHIERLSDTELDELAKQFDDIRKEWQRRHSQAS